MRAILLLLLSGCLLACQADIESASDTVPVAPLQTGAEQLTQYLPLLQGKRVGLLVNQTSRVGDQHLVDVLLAHNVNIVSIFAPEHGFRGVLIEIEAQRIIQATLKPWPREGRLRGENLRECRCAHCHVERGNAPIWATHLPDAPAEIGPASIPWE